MKSIKRAVTALCLGAMAALRLAAADEAQSGGAVEAIRIATGAYGYPLVHQVDACRLS